MIEVKPSSPFPNGLSYHCFVESFCYRCKKGEIDEYGYAAFPENGGCKIWDAMENARFNEGEYPNAEIVQVERNGKVVYWHVCKSFEAVEERIMEQYKTIFEDEE